MTALDDLLDLGKAINSLPPYEQFITRAILEGYGYQEIGDFLSMTRQAVCYRYRNIREKLARDYQVDLEAGNFSTPVSKVPCYSDNPDYLVYNGMMSRCYNPALPNYAYYGHQGVEVCSRWFDDPLTFFEDMGPKPPGYSVDRIDPTGHYEPANCRWADNTEQANNRRADSGLTQEARDWFMRNVRDAQRRAQHEYQRRKRQERWQARKLRQPTLTDKLLATLKK